MSRQLVMCRFVTLRLHLNKVWKYRSERPCVFLKYHSNGVRSHYIFNCMWINATGLFLIGSCYCRVESLLFPTFLPPTTFHPVILSMVYDHFVYVDISIISIVKHHIISQKRFCSIKILCRIVST